MMISSVFIAISTLFKKIRLIAISITDRISESLMDIAIDFRSADISLLPKFCAIITENPFVIPCANPIINSVKADILPIAASELSPSPLPTIALSAKV